MMAKIAQHACVWLLPLKRMRKNVCPFSVRIPLAKHIENACGFIDE
ncbi:hypothetical protein ACLMJV_08465 [Sinorhizobium meliloti]